MRWSKLINNDKMREKRQATPSTYQPFRIAIHYVMENITDALSTLPVLQNEFGGFQQAISYAQSVISVVRTPGNLTLTPFRCSDYTGGENCTAEEDNTVPENCGSYVTIPREHVDPSVVCDPICRDVDTNATAGVDADFIYYVTAVQDGKVYAVFHHIY